MNSAFNYGIFYLFFQNYYTLNELNHGTHGNKISSSVYHGPSYYKVGLVMRPENKTTTGGFWAF